MPNPYQNPHAAFTYLEFLDSPNGRIQQEILSDAILARTEDAPPQAKILDAACGSGWLSEILAKKFSGAQACDGAEIFIQLARSRAPEIDFRVADLSSPLPYPKDYFDLVILNMAAPDLENLPKTFQNLGGCLAKNGKLILTIPNPALTYPAAVWKRNLWDILTGKKPKLVFKSPPPAGIVSREFGRHKKIASRYYAESDYLAAARQAGLNLTLRQEIRSARDSGKFDLHYQMFRYPLLLLLEFQKSRQ